MSNRPADAWLQDIVLWAEHLARHVEGFTIEGFLDDVKTRHAVWKCVEVIDEASRRLMIAERSFRTERSDLRLAVAYRTRNQLAHGCYEIDADILWRTATLSVPEIVTQARAILAARRADPVP